MSSGEATLVFNRFKKAAKEKVELKTACQRCGRLPEVCQCADSNSAKTVSSSMALTNTSHKDVSAPFQKNGDSPDRSALTNDTSISRRKGIASSWFTRESLAVDLNIAAVFFILQIMLACFTLRINSGDWAASASILIPLVSVAAVIVAVRIVLAFVLPRKTKPAAKLTARKGLADGLNVFAKMWIFMFVYALLTLAACDLLVPGRPGTGSFAISGLLLMPLLGGSGLVLLLHEIAIFFIKFGQDERTDSAGTLLLKQVSSFVRLFVQTLAVGIACSGVICLIFFNDIMWVRAFSLMLHNPSERVKVVERAQYLVKIADGDRQAPAIYKLGEAYQYTNNFTEAATQYKRAIAVLEASKTNVQLEAVCLESLAQLSAQQKQFGDAEHFQEQAIKLVKERPAGKHEGVRMLGSLYMKLGVFGESLPSLQMNLAALYLDEKKVPKAEALFKQVLLENENIPEPDSIFLTEVIGKYATLLRAQGRAKEVAPLYRQALSKIENSKLKDYQIGMAQESFADLFVEEKAYDDAESTLKKSIITAEKSWGVGGTEAVKARIKLADFYASQNKDELAENYYKTALDLARKYHRDSEAQIQAMTKYYIADAARPYGLFLIKKNRLPEAKALIDEAVDADQSTALGGANWRLRDDWLARTKYQRAAKQYAEAEKGLRQILEQLEEPSLNQSPKVDVLREYAALLKQMGRTEEAAQKEKQAAAIITK